MLSSSFLSRSGFALVFASLTACTIATSPAGGSDTAQHADGGVGPDAAGGSSSPSPSQPSGPLPFTPSNGVDLSGLDSSKAKDEVSLTGECTIDGEASTIDCGTNRLAPFATKIVTLADQTRVSVFLAKSFRIETSTVVRTKGALPIVFAALDTISVLGTIQVLPGTSGGALQTEAHERGGGAGGGSASTESGLAGGGASFCGLGGKPGSAGPVINEPAPAYGNAELVPLVGGSAGASGWSSNRGSSGGGALQMMAGKSITVTPSGAISAGGGAGADGTPTGEESGAGGGGSGGALLLEAPSVTVAGTLAANGGSGGGAGGYATSDGTAGRAESQPAQGGAGLNVGGDGSAGLALNGGHGAWDPTKKENSFGIPPSGGGGGAGRIRINTSTGHASITGATSPALTTPCATEGTFTH